ncbi:MAG: hypothetical protein KDA78_14535 [Planctomycetaceae bacterium]|nr:hypothetical protein [Planctomycetaceae bacterium]
MKKTLALILACCWSAGFLSCSLADEPVFSEKDIREVHNLFSEQAVDGAMIMHQGDCLAVKVFTQSPYTHVAMMFCNEEGRWVVYDSANGTGVRKSELIDYLTECAPNHLVLLNPNQPLSEDQKSRLLLALEEQIGRPYGIKHHISGKPAKGVHCSEYITSAMVSAGYLTAERPAKVSPASLRAGLLNHHLYSEIAETEMIVASIPPVPQSTWCSQMWSDTKACFSGTYQKCSRMFFCCD